MQERRTWEKQGCFLKNDIWYHPDGRTVCPRSLFLPLSRLAHGQAHMGKGGMIHAINVQWYAPGITVTIEKVARTCQICQQNNRGKTPAEYDHLPQPSMPFENLQIDFVHMPPVSGFKYLLVIVDMFTRWVEAYATRRDDARTVVKTLFKEIVPRYGIPMGINSDRGTHFTGKIVQNLAEALGFQWKLHIPYQPQSSGIVERVNGIIKSTLTKVCQETGLKWPEALPLVLYTLRNQKNRNTGLTSHEALLGRPMPTGVKPPLVAEKLALIWNDEKSLKYAQAMCEIARSLHEQIKQTQVTPSEGNMHPFRPGDQVLVKTLNKESFSPRWKGPYQIILTTRTALKLEKHPNWVHATRCKYYIPDDLQSEEEALHQNVPRVPS